MLHFKNKDGLVYAYASQAERDKYGTADLKSITQKELDAYLASIKPVPASCTRRQGLLALLEFGFKRSDIESKIAAIDNEIEREQAQIEYEANVWERSNARLQQMWASLGGAPEQLDDVFRMAVTL